MADIKHVGRIIGTGKKCIVAYRTLPGDAYNCLIIPTESLPDMFHDALINLVESNTGQSSYEFAEALARTNFPDGSIMLAALHTQNKLIKVATDLVEMLPRPAVSIILSELNQIIAEQRGIPVDELSIKQPDKQENAESTVTEDKKVPQEDVTKTTYASVNYEAEPVIDEADPIVAAKQYRSQADKLAKQAANYRRLAEELVPTVKKEKETVKKLPVSTKKTKVNV